MLFNFLLEIIKEQAGREAGRGNRKKKICSFLITEFKPGQGPIRM